MSWLRLWILGIIAAVMVVTVILALVPEGRMRSIARFTGGLVLLLAIVRPVAQVQPEWVAEEYDRYARQIQEELADLQEENLEKTEAIIARETAAYISDKGEALGLVCHPTVTTRLEGGVPYPDAVTMDIPRNEELARIIAQELDIPVQRQKWQEE